jgi:hypothetical protein
MLTPWVFPAVLLTPSNLASCDKRHMEVMASERNMIRFS